MSFVKLSELSKNKSVVEIKSVKKPVWKMYDPGSKKMVESNYYQQGMSKKYGVSTDKGDFDLGEQNFGTLLALAYDGTSSQIIGRKFKVSDNGKEGMEIRYYFNIEEYTPQDYSQPTIPTQADVTPPLPDNEYPF